MPNKFKVPDSEIKHFVLPELRGDIVGMKDEAKGYQTVEEIEAIQKKAFNQAVKKGHEKGLQQGLAEAAKLTNIFNFLQSPLKELDKQVESQLTELALLIAKLLLKKECEFDIEHIQKLIHDSLEYLPVKTRDIVVHLNAADIALLQKSEVNIDEQRWKYIADNSVRQGGCVIESSTSHIDASVETRVQQLVEQLNLPPRKVKKSEEK